MNLLARERLPRSPGAWLAPFVARLYLGRPELAGLIAEATGFEGGFEWNSTRPDGQPRRSLDVSRAREVLGWEAATPLEDGLAETVRWYREHPAN